ncbi:MAG: phosphoribosyltransferase [Cyanobacteria bacterium J083]|nr:MAG: phosphoribosyltransferase [Cyanobacteria bacterium J083]
MKTRFRDRTEAGRLLAKILKPTYANQPNVIVLALPRGGVPIGYEIAKALNVPLDLCLVRKLGVPGHEELAMGAIATGGIMLLNENLVRSLRISPQAIQEVVIKEQKELKRRDQLYRGDRPAPDLTGRTVIIVDDGIATGSTLKAAIAAIKQQKPEKIIVAVPVAPPDVCQELKNEVDEVVCLLTPEWLYSISLWYDDFSPTTDEEVRRLLAETMEEKTAKSS